MDFREILRRRRMVRRFDGDRQVADESLRRVLEAAVRAPSAGFTQGTDLLLLREAADRMRFWASQVGESGVARPTPWLSGMAGAPALVAVLASAEAYVTRYAEADKASARGGGPQAWPVPYWDVDAGMAVVLMLLAAVDEGLGAAFFALRDDRHGAFAEAFAVPSSHRCVGVVAVGHATADEAPGGSPSRRARRALSDVVHEGRFGTHPLR